MMMDVLGCRTQRYTESVYGCDIKKRHSKKTYSVGLTKPTTNSLTTTAARKHEDNSIQKCMKILLFIGECCGVCPVTGITCKTAKDLRFSWRSVRTLYSLLMTIAMSVSIGFAIVRLIAFGFTFTTANTLVFHMSGFLHCMFFLRAARLWPELARLWEQTEERLKQYGNPKFLCRKIWCKTILFLSLALLEHLLRSYSHWHTSSQCYSEMNDVFKGYLVLKEPHVSQLVGYRPILAMVAAANNFLSIFCWTFSDLFVMLTSLALASRFQLFNHHLKLISGKVMSAEFWRGAREDFNSLSTLTKQLNNVVSRIILVSLSSNVFYICRRLLHMPRSNEEFIVKVHFYASFAFLLLRVISTALCAASVYHECRTTKDVIYSVPPSHYHLEVHRFLLQVSTDDVVLTGLNFFTVTRSLLPTLAGTIVTYEVVLLQVGNSKTEDSDFNITTLCQNLNEIIFR